MYNGVTDPTLEERVLNCAISSSSDDNSGPVSPATLLFGLTNLFFNSA
jgi:hypothetical protein